MPQPDTSLSIYYVLFFLLAAVNGLFAHRFLDWARQLREAGRETSASYALFSALGHHTTIFAIWLVPTAILTLVRFGPEVTHDIFVGADLEEPFARFTFIFLALSPVLRLMFSAICFRITNWLRGGIKTWWMTTIVVGSLLAGTISEAAAMVLVCYSLLEYALDLKPSAKFCYLTLAITLTCMALGNLVIPYNLTTSLDLSSQWGWSHWTVLQNISLPALICILAVTGAATVALRKDFAAMQDQWKRSSVYSKTVFSPVAVLYLVCFLVAAQLEHHPYALMMLVGLVLIAENEIAEQIQSTRLKLPLQIAFFNYAMELHAHFLQEPTSSVYGWFGSTGQAVKTLILSGLNEHIPGEALVSAFASLGSNWQVLGIATLAVGSGLTLFANSANVEAVKIMRNAFPDRYVNGLKFLGYSIPVVLLTFGLLMLLLSGYQAVI